MHKYKLGNDWIELDSGVPYRLDPDQGASCGPDSTCKELSCSDIDLAAVVVARQAVAAVVWQSTA